MPDKVKRKPCNEKQHKIIKKHAKNKNAPRKHSFAQQVWISFNSEPNQLGAKLDQQLRCFDANKSWYGRALRSYRSFAPQTGQMALFNAVSGITKAAYVMPP